MRKYKTAIIGLGNIGYGLQRYGVGFPTTHFEAYIQNNKTNLVALCDINGDVWRSIERKYKNKFRFYSNWRILIEKEGPEIVSICTPDETHYPILRGVVNSKYTKAIWCEKPIAVSQKQGKEMVRLCKNKNIKLQVNYIRRYDKLYHYIKSNIEQLLGDLSAVTFYYSGGITTNGSHALDLLDFLLGKCLQVSAEETAAGIAGRLKFKNNVIANIVPIPGKDYSIFEMNMFGSRARLDIITKPFNQYDYRYVLPEKSEAHPAKIIAKNEASPINRRFPRDYFPKALKDIVDSISYERSPKSSGETALKSLELISALVHSAKNQGKKTRIPFYKLNTKIPMAQGDLKIWQKKN